MTKPKSERNPRFLPYHYARHGLDLRLTECLLDSKERADTSAPERLVEIDAHWLHATLSLTALVTRAIWTSVLGNDSSAQVVVVSHCAPTRWRHGTIVALQPDSPVNLTVELSREELAGTVELVGYLVRKHGHVASTPRPATRGGVRVADSVLWTLSIDRSSETRGDYLEIRYRRFSTDDALRPRDRANLYLLDLDIETPVLWINSDHEKIAAVLDSKGTVGRNARLREALFDQIAYAVWTQLFLHAAQSFVSHGELAHEWEQGALDQLLPDVYPDVRYGQERAARLRLEWDERATVLGRLDSALQRRNRLVEHLGQLIEEGFIQ